MMNAVPDRMLSLQDYYLLEETGDMKHEYYQGAIYNMAGASVRQNLITASIVSALHPQLLGKGCAVFPSDLRVKIEATGLYTYPDAQVICGNIRHADKRKDTVTNPTVLIEVLLPGTEGYDRGTKFQHYRAIESLQEYLVIAQDSVRVEQYTRQGEHKWLLTEFTRVDQIVHLVSINSELALAAIYAGVDFEDESQVSYDNDPS